MTYYTPDNPNHALVSRPQKHPVREGIRITFIILLAVLLIVSTILTVFTASFRLSITPEYVYSYADGLDYAEFPLPVDGTFQSISQLMLDAFNGVGFNLNEADIALLFDEFSIPVILAGFAQDTTAWLLHDGSRPVLDPDEIASIALSGVDSSIMTILRFLGDPVALVGKMLTDPLSRLDTDSVFDALEPVRTLLSVHSMTILISVSALLAVLLFCLCRCRFTAFCLPASISVFVSSLTALAMGFLPALLMPRFTVVYASYILGFLSPVISLLWRAALIGGGISLVLFAVWLISRLLASPHRRMPCEDWKGSGF